MRQSASAEYPPTQNPPKENRGEGQKGASPMKELNRRAFLTLSGAAVVALSLAGSRTSGL